MEDGPVEGSAVEEEDTEDTAETAAEPDLEGARKLVVNP